MAATHGSLDNYFYHIFVPGDYTVILFPLKKNTEYFHRTVLHCELPSFVYINPTIAVHFLRKHYIPEN